jgi:hypothetical protein
VFNNGVGYGFVLKGSSGGSTPFLKVRLKIRP